MKDRPGRPGGASKADLKNFISTCLRRNRNDFDQYQVLVLNQRIMESFDTFNIDLAIFHWISVDSEEVFERAIAGKVPYLIINHFDNERFMLKTVKKWVRHAVACGGVSNINVPPYISSKFMNVSDGIDTDFFDPDKAKPMSLGTGEPMVFLPSRITPYKGHLDLIQAASSLRSMGIQLKVAFAGREDSAAFGQELQSCIKKLDMQDHVIFAGHLGPAELRDWYGASTVVALPSYSEGLPRVLLEAQAMGKPVIAYDTGGVSEAMKDGMSGYLVSKGNIRSLGDRLTELLSSNDKRREMGTCGKSFVVEHFSPLSLAIRHENLYVKALSSGE